MKEELHILCAYLLASITKRNFQKEKKNVYKIHDENFFLKSFQDNFLGNTSIT